MKSNNYSFTLKNHLISKTNLFNQALSNPNQFNVKLSSVFNTFKNEKNLKLIRIYLVIFYISNQRPFIKKVRFSYIKKKVLKRFFISVSLSKQNRYNFLFYLSNFYSYFFHIYYQKGLKYNYIKNHFIFYLDNIQFFFKNYNKHNQKIQIKVIVFSKNAISNNNLLLKFLNNIFFIKTKN